LCSQRFCPKVACFPSNPLSGLGLGWSSPPPSLWSSNPTNPGVCVSPQVLASYVNPAGCLGGSGGGGGEAQTSGESRPHNSNALPAVLQELLSQSCLIPAMSSYLRNDSGRNTAVLVLYIYIYIYVVCTVLLIQTHYCPMQSYATTLGGKHLTFAYIVPYTHTLLST